MKQIVISRRQKLREYVRKKHESALQLWSNISEYAGLSRKNSIREPNR